MEIGDLYLIKTKDNKVFPILYVKNKDNKYFCFKLRKASDGDLFNHLDIKQRLKYNKGKPAKEHKKILNESEIKTVLLDKPLNSQSKSVVKIGEIYGFNPNIVLKKIGKISMAFVEKCLERHAFIMKAHDLHNELHEIKKKIKYAQFNNERYSHLEKRKDEILNELGYDMSGQKAHSINTRKNNLTLKHRGINKSFYSGR